MRLVKLVSDLIMLKGNDRWYSLNKIRDIEDRRYEFDAAVHSLGLSVSSCSCSFELTTSPIRTVVSRVVEPPFTPMSWNISGA